MNRTNLIVMTVGFFVLLASVFAQNMPPKAGTYYCYTSQYDPANAVVYSITYTPAFFGNIILDGKGNYTLTMRKNKGKYMFDKASGKMTFTGDLSIMTYRNYPSQKDTFVLSYEDLGFVCGLSSGATGSGKAGDQGSKPAQGSGSGSSGSGSSGSSNTTAAKLNGGLTGKIVGTISYEFNSFLGSVFEFDLAKGTSSLLFSSGVAHRNGKGEMIHFDKNARLKLTDKAGKTLKQLSSKEEFSFPDLYPALSPSGEYIALNLAHYPKTGQLTDLVSDGSALTINRNGDVIAEFLGYTQAAWTPDGRIVAVGEGTQRGLSIIDNRFGDAQPLAEGGFEEAQTPAVSPDGKRIAFVNLDKTLIIGIDGSNPVETIINSKMSFPAWSPNGKYLAVNVIDNDGPETSFLFIVNLAADTAFWAKDKAGNRLASKNRISWTP